MGLIPRWDNQSLGEGNGNSLQYPNLKNPMDRGVWWTTVHGAAKSWTQLRMQSLVKAAIIHLHYDNPGRFLF